MFRVAPAAFAGICDRVWPLLLALDALDCRSTCAARWRLGPPQFPPRDLPFAPGSRTDATLNVDDLAETILALEEMQAPAERLSKPSAARLSASRKV